MQSTTKPQGAGYFAPFCVYLIPAAPVMAAIMATVMATGRPGATVIVAPVAGAAALAVAAVAGVVAGPVLLVGAVVVRPVAGTVSSSPVGGRGGRGAVRALVAAPAPALNRLDPLALSGLRVVAFGGLLPSLGLELLVSGLRGQQILDIGPEILEEFHLPLREEHSVLWVNLAAGLLGGLQGPDDGLGVQGGGVQLDVQDLEVELGVGGVPGDGLFQDGLCGRCVGLVEPEEAGVLDGKVGLGGGLLGLVDAVLVEGVDLGDVAAASLQVDPSQEEGEHLGVLGLALLEDVHGRVEVAGVLFEGRELEVDVHLGREVVRDGAVVNIPVGRKRKS